jgi:hypothetical protein
LLSVAVLPGGRWLSLWAAACRSSSSRRLRAVWWLNGYIMSLRAGWLGAARDRASQFLIGLLASCGVLTA